jgi:uncharacterized membrane protein
MKEMLVAISEPAIIAIDAIALLLVIIGTVDAVIRGVPALLGSSTGHERRDVWLRYARWLVAALTFQLAADIIETSITEDREALIRIAVIAVIRTLLNYFLEKDLGETRAEQREDASEVRRERTEPA